MVARAVLENAYYLHHYERAVHLLKLLEKNRHCGIYQCICIYGDKSYTIILYMAADPGPGSAGGFFS